MYLPDFTIPPGNYAGSFAALPSAVAALVVFALGLAVLVRERLSRVGWIQFLLAWAIGAWQLCLTFSILSTTVATGTWWATAGTAASILIPVCEFHLAAVLVSRAPETPRYVYAGWAAAAALLLTLFATGWFYQEVTWRGWGWYAHYGVGGYVFVAITVVLVNVSFLLCRRMVRDQQARGQGTAARRGRVLLAGLGLGSLGGVDFVPALGFDVFPFGGIALMLGSICNGYASWRYRLVEITPAFAAREFMDTMSDGVAVVDPEGVVRLVNPSLLRMLGYAQGELLHSRPPAAVAVLLYGAEGEGAWQVQACVGQEREYQDPLGQKRTLSVSISLMRDGGGQLQAVLVTIRDITAALAARERIKRLAYYDPLTKLPNRVLLEERFGQAIARAERAGAMAAVLYLDLDRFKHVNDTLGHDAGDRLLQVVSERIAACVRESDLVVRNAESAHDATLARLGGDEFVLLLSPIERGEDAAKVAMRVLQSLSQPVEVGAGAPVATGVSIGIALYPDDGQNPEVLMKRAGLAMYHAKGAGRNSAHFFDEGMNIRTRERRDNESSLRRAFERFEILLHYQPIIDARAATVTGLVARVFWDHARHGLLPAREFQTLARDTGLAVPLGNWVLHTACMQVRAWDASGLPPLRLAVLASPALLERGDVVASVRTALAESGLPPERLLVGIHTPATRADRDRTAATIDALAALGVTLVLDDFGVGDLHPSLVLAQPVKAVRFSAPDNDSRTKGERVVGSGLIGFARGAGLDVVVDAVADPAEAAAWRDRGADLLIGPAFADAVAAEDVPATLDLLAFRRRSGTLFADRGRPDSSP